MAVVQVPVQTAKIRIGGSVIDHLLSKGLKVDEILLASDHQSMTVIGDVTEAQVKTAMNSYTGNGPGVTKVRLP